MLLSPPSLSPILLKPAWSLLAKTFTGWVPGPFLTQGSEGSLEGQVLSPHRKARPGWRETWLLGLALLSLLV